MTASMPSAFVLKASAELPQPEHCLRHLTEHLREDGLDVTVEGRTVTVTLPDVRGRMWCESDLLVVEAASRDAETAYFVKSWIEGVVEHLAAGAPFRIAWKESCRTHKLPPSFSILKVQALQMISPQMKRITLSGTNIESFDRSDALHIQVLVNFSSVMAATASAKALPVWRRYTIRSVEVSLGTIEVDVFLHGHDGPGALWAANLRIGDFVGIAGPSGANIEVAERYLIAGDEAALPAIDRILSLLPFDAKGDVLIEVGEVSNRLPLRLPHGMNLTWLDRASGISSIDTAIVRHLSFHESKRVSVWVGCEAEAASRTRRHLKSRMNLAKISHLVIGYWRKG